MNELNDSRFCGSEMWFRISLEDYKKKDMLPKSLKDVRFWKEWSDVYGQLVKPGRDLDRFRESRRNLLEAVEKLGLKVQYM